MLGLKTRAAFSGMMFTSSTSISEKVLFTLFLSSVSETLSFPVPILLHPSPVFSFSLSPNSSLSLSVRLTPPRSEMQSDFTLVLSPSLTGRVCGSGLFSGHCRVLGSIFADLIISSSSSEMFTSATHWGVWGTAAGPGGSRSTVPGNQNRNSGNERLGESANSLSK